MIVPMQKASIILLDRFREQSLTELRRLGLLHIHSRHATSQELTRLVEQKNQIERSVLILPAEAPKDKSREEGKRKRSRRSRRADGPEPSPPPAQAHAAEAEAARAHGADLLQESFRLAEEASACAERIRGIRESLERLQKEQKRLSVWGEFDPDEIRGLAPSGVFLRLYDLSDRQLRELDAAQGQTDCYRFVLSRTRERVRLAVVFLTEGQRLELQGEPLEEFPLPERGVGRVRALAADALRELDAQQERLEALARQKELLLQGIRRLDESIAFVHYLNTLQNDLLNVKLASAPGPTGTEADPPADDGDAQPPGRPAIIRTAL